MEWEPNERDAWVQDAERWIAQIKGVLQCKIDLDTDGEVSAIHVVASEDRAPRRIVRDVEGLLKARLGIAVYYKKISVVQMMEIEEDEIPDADESLQAAEAPVGFPSPSAAPPPAAPEPVRPDFGLYEEEDDEALPAILLEESMGPRITCGGVGVMLSEKSIRAEVELTAGQVETRGSEEGPNHADSDLVMIGRATINAIRQLLVEPILLNLSDVGIQTLAHQQVVLAAVELVEGRRSERLFGTCSTEHNRAQAVVYAVLDALNRRLSLMALKTGEEED